MPIASHKPTAEPTVKPNLPKIEPAEYKSIVREETTTPLNSLIAYVGGAPWTVNYYSQIISKHNDLREQDAGQSNIYQQYSKIVGLEIRVSTPIDSSQDQGTNLVTVTGSGIVYSFLVPNVGDMFIASTGDGEDGLFRITNTERKNFNRDSVFAIDYDLVTYISRDAVRFEDLESKVNNTSYFSKDRLVEGLAPVLREEEYQQVNSLSNYYRELVLYYFKNFYSKAVGTLILPGQSAIIYDSFVVDYVLRIVNSTDAPEIRNTTNITVSQDQYLTQPQFWTAMLDRNFDTITHCNRKMGLVQSVLFNNNPTIKGIRFSRMEYVVYPEEADLSINIGTMPFLKIEAMAGVEEASSGSSSMASLLHNQFVDQNITVPLTHRVLTDDFYVLSNSFYNSTNGQSLLETLITDYLKGAAINTGKLCKVIERYRNWGRLEQFYYIPILLTLIKASNNGAY